jgi:hypothetical protein
MNVRVLFLINYSSYRQSVGLDDIDYEVLITFSTVKEN